MNDLVLVLELEVVKVCFVGWLDNKWLSMFLFWVVLVFLFFVVWNFLIWCMGGVVVGGLMEIGKSKVKVYM